MKGFISSCGPHIGKAMLASLGEQCFDALSLENLPVKQIPLECQFRSQRVLIFPQSGVLELVDVEEAQLLQQF